MNRTLFVICTLVAVLATSNGCTCFVACSPGKVVITPCIGGNYPECRKEPKLYVMSDLQIKHYQCLLLEPDSAAAVPTWLAEQVNTNASTTTFYFLPAYPYGHMVHSIEWRFSDEPKRWSRARATNIPKLGLGGFAFGVPNHQEGYREVELVATYKPSCRPTLPEEWIVQRFLIPVKLQGTNCGLREP